MNFVNDILSCFLSLLRCRICQMIFYVPKGCFCREDVSKAVSRHVLLSRCRSLCRFYYPVDSRRHRRVFGMPCRHNGRTVSFSVFCHEAHSWRLFLWHSRRLSARRSFFYYLVIFFFCDIESSRNIHLHYLAFAHHSDSFRNHVKHVEIVMVQGYHHAFCQQIITGKNCDFVFPDSIY